MCTVSFAIVRNRGNEDSEKDCGADKDPKIDIFINITELPMTIDPHGNEIVHHDRDEEDYGKKQKACFPFSHDITSHHHFTCRGMVCK